MKVSLSTYGGLAGGLGRPTHAVDDRGLEGSDKLELHRLVAAAAAEPAGGRASERVRDAQTYAIEIEDHGTSTTLEAADGAVPPAFAALRDWLRVR